MLAKCARCQTTFAAQSYGRQRCPNCQGEILLPDPAAPVAGTVPDVFSSNASVHQAAGTEETSPFARRSELGFWQGFFQTLRAVALEPTLFFSRLSVGSAPGQVSSAVLFGVIGMTVGSLLSLLFAIPGQGFFWNMLAEKFPAAAIHAPPGLALLSIGAAVLMPLFALSSIYVWAAVDHAILALLGGASRGFDGTLTASGYAHGLFLLGAIPFCGGLLSSVWYYSVVIIALTRIHRTSSGKASLAVMSPFLAACCCAAVAGSWLASLYFH